MTDIQTFPFDSSKFEQLREYHYGLNWPVVYIQEDGKEMYIGQTTNVYSRSKQHYENPNRARLKRIHILTDEEFNMSAAYDFESLLIQYVSADGKFKLQNANGGLVNHNYYDRERYLSKLETIWPLLREKDLVINDLSVIKNSDFFKYSPYKALNEDQLLIARQLEKNIVAGKESIHMVHGGPGTGKTILALYLMKHLREQDRTKHLKIGLVIAMTGLRNTLKKVLKKVPNMGEDMVIGPADVVKENYDLLFVDEAHRLRRRVNLTNFPSYDSVTKKLGLANDATQLDWVLKSAGQKILFYDEQQSIVPGDVRAIDFTNLKAKHYNLVSQMRVEGGDGYLKFVDDFLTLKRSGSLNFSNYDFQLFESITEMLEAIRNQDEKHSLSRVVAGYAWPWKSKKKKDAFDIEIEGVKLRWNSTNIDWVNSKNAINEIGCIHTTQGYDLNYAGVIIGPELSYDEETDRIVVNKDKYEDFNGKRSVSHPEELEQYVKNIYRTLLTRGIKGTYIYIVDEALRVRIKKLLQPEVIESPVQLKDVQSILSPISAETVLIPLVGTAPCGNPVLGEENIEDQIAVPKNKIKSGYMYFIIRASGDSMNLVGIQDEDLLLCRFGVKPETGDRVVALLNNENVTVKFYDKKDGRRILLPKSTNKKHQPIVPDEGDSVIGVVQEVLQ